MCVVAMAMFVLFVGLVAYALFVLIRKVFGLFNDRINRMVHSAQVAVDAFKFADHGIKDS